jgi:hypothetical protein
MADVTEAARKLRRDIPARSNEPNAAGRWSCAGLTARRLSRDDCWKNCDYRAMAILSRELGVLFIQTPHTGSTAIGKLLREHLGGVRIPAEPPASGGGDGTVKHATLEELMTRGQITAEDRSGLVVAAGVRNPWDHVVTAFMRAQSGQGKWKGQRTAPRELDFEAWVRARYAPSLLKRVRGQMPHRPKDYLSGVDQIIRYEHLQEDFDELMRRVDAPPVEVPRVNVTTAKEEAAQHWSTYFSPASRAIVADAYADWIERFSYRFEGT